MGKRGRRDEGGGRVGKGCMKEGTWGRGDQGVPVKQYLGNSAAKINCPRYVFLRRKWPSEKYKGRVRTRSGEVKDKVDGLNCAPVPLSLVGND